MEKSFNSIGKLASWALLFVSFWYYLHATEWCIGETADNETFRIAYIFIGSSAAICTTLLAPRTVFYDIVRYVLLGVLWIDSYHFNGNTVLTWFFPAAAVILLPSVINDLRGKGVRLTDLPVSSIHKPVSSGTNSAAGRPSVSYKDVLNQKGFNHIREVKTWFGETTYSARDRHGDEWTITCERDGGKIKIKGARKQGMTDDDLIAMMEAFSDD